VLPLFRNRFGIDFNILLPWHASGLHGTVSVPEPVHGEPPLDEGGA